MTGKNQAAAQAANQPMPGDNQAVDAAQAPCKKGEGPRNVVTPKLETEYLVVLLDRKLAQYQDAADPKKFHADPTLVEVAIGETNVAHKYPNGLKFICTPANVDVYLDAKCEDKDKLGASGMVTKDQLRANPKLKLWLKGKAAGKFTAKVELIDPVDAKIRIEKPAELKMGVVALEMKLHHQDQAKIKALQVHPDVEPVATYHTELKDLDLPDQLEMTDQEKVNPGRLLHAQKKQSFSRARLLIKKYDQDHWPAGTDDYEVSLGTQEQGESIEIHDKEWDDGKKSDIKIKVSDLKKKEHEFWIQGKNPSDPAADIRYELGLDRADGGMAKTRKRNGDWVRFRVVRIQEVKLDYTAPPGGASAWDAAKKRFYINLVAGNAGRKVTIGAKLSAKHKDVTIHFMLAPDKKNLKKDNWGVDLPGTWIWKDIDAALKHEDKSARTDFLHLSAKTDADGYAKVDLMLSRFGGDKFHPAAYIDQDPHLAKFVKGHDKLEKKKPVIADSLIAVWRKIWYQISRPQGFNPPSPKATVGAYEKVHTELVLDQDLQFTAATAPANTFYPEHMLKVKSTSTTQVANIGNVNKIALSNLLVADAAQPVKRHLLVCRYQCDTKPSELGTSDPVTDDKTGEWMDIIVSNTLYVLEPALDGTSMIESLYWYRDSDKVQHNIPAASARIPVPRKARGHIQVQVPAIAPLPTAADPVYIAAKCKMSKHFLGESFGVRHTLAVFDKSDVADYMDTVTHEFGHSFNQTPRPAAQPGSPAIPDHPTQLDAGQGNHCQVNKGTDFLSGETKFTCVMYDSGPMKWGLHKFCKTCHPYLLVEDFHKP